MAERKMIYLDDAVKALEQAYPNDGQMSCHDAVAVIATLPTIESERRKGKWVKQNPMVDTEECSECGYNIQSEELETPFCPWCGANNMRGDMMQNATD